MKLLIIEDESRTAEEIASYLTTHGFEVECQEDGRAGLERALDGGFDAITMDRMLPSLDGLEILSTLRAKGVTTPVLVLSALGDVDERIRGLRAGGDDYLTKPFSLAELTARLEALLRRRPVEAPMSLLRVADLEMDLLTRDVRRAGVPIDLTQREFKLLEYMLRNEGQLLTRSMIFESVWDYHFDPGTNVIDVHIGRLRRKVDGDRPEPLIRTIRGSGWILDAPR